MMEDNQIICDNFNHPTCLDQGFQTDRFTKKLNHLNIPDTIPENCSAELSEDILRKEALDVVTKSLSNEGKENTDNTNQQDACNESSNLSINIAVDSSYIRECERKLLESSNSDDEKSIESEKKGLVNKQFMGIPRKLIYQSDTLYTPPSVLKKEISLLRNEMAETHEFHDFEIQVLKEEKCLHEIDSESYLELFEKYSALTELYTSLKTEYDEYRKTQEKMRHELQSRTADCLESLCSQIETSDNSLNFSNASFVSFSGGIKSSTLMEDVSEVETTVLHDATILAKDPLSISSDGKLKTPNITSLKSPKKLFPQNISFNSTAEKRIVKQIKNATPKNDISTSFDSESNIQLLNLETALYDKIKEVEDLEQRLFKVEDLFSVLQSEFERITSDYVKENNSLKENLLKKTEQLDELTQKLFTEITSLDPSLGNSLIDMPGTKLLVVFMETIMESCKKIQNEEITKHSIEKAEWETRRKAELLTVENLQNQLSFQSVEMDCLRKKCDNLEKKILDSENAVIIRDENIQMLQSHLSNIRETREEFTAVTKALSETESRLTLTEALKTAAENRYRELETINEDLKREIDLNSNLRLDLQTQLTFAEQKTNKIESENVYLKELLDTLKAQLTGKLQAYESELTTMKSNLLSAEETVLKLKSQLESTEVEKLQIENRCTELEENNQNLLVQIASAKNLENNPAYEKIQNENNNLTGRIFESEKVIAELKMELELAKKDQMSNICRVEELIREIEELKAETSEFSRALVAIEETQKDLAGALSDVSSDNDLPGDRITKLIENTVKLPEPGETRETKLIAGFVETITKTCKGVQNELIKKLDIEKSEWETQRDVDLHLIEKLQNQIKVLDEKDAQRETILKETKDDLAVSNETIAQLKSQISVTQTKNEEIELRCRKLEEDVLNLQTDIDTKETILKGFDELKLLRKKSEEENVRLKQEIAESEGAIGLFKKSAEMAEAEQKKLESRINELQNEIHVLKKENEELVILSEKLNNLENNNKNLMEILWDIQTYLDIPEDTVSKLLSGNIENKKIFIEQINNLMKIEKETIERESRIFWEEKIQIKLEDANKCENLEVKLANAQKTISDQKEKIQILYIDMQHTEKNLAAAKESLSELESRVLLVEADKKKAECGSQALKEMVENLERNIDVNKNLVTELEAQLSSAEEKKLKAENENIRLMELYEVLKVQMIEAQEIISKRNEDILVLKSHESLLESKLIELEDYRKMCENLGGKLSDAQNTILIRDEEIKMLQSNLVQIQGDIASYKEALSEKIETPQRCQEMEKIIENLKQEIELKENLRNELKTQHSETENENVQLKKLHDVLKLQITESENVIKNRDEEIRMLKSYNSELTTIKSNLLSAEETVLKLKSQLESTEVEKLQIENRCTELEENNQNLLVQIASAKNLENNPAYEKIQNENKNLTGRIFESEKVIAELKMELELAKKDQMSNICRVEELIREIEELKAETSEFSRALVAIEETQKDLAGALSDVSSDNDLPGDRITKLIENTVKFPEPGETRGTKLIAGFVETITKTCKGVQNELIKKLDIEKSEWETQRDVDLHLIEKLQNQIKVLDEKDAQRETILKETKDDLAVSNETIAQLKSQISVTQTKNEEIELRCRKLEEDILNLQTDIDTKETILKGFDELKLLRKKSEEENVRLKQEIAESEGAIGLFKKSAEMAEAEQKKLESRINELQNEIHVLKKENEELVIFSEKLKNLENNNKNLMEILWDIQTYLDIPEDTVSKLLSGNIENKKIFIEKINGLIINKAEGLKTEIQSLKLGNNNLKEKMKQLTRMIGESASREMKDEFFNGSSPHSHNVSFRSKSGRNIELCLRRLDKLEEINHNLTDLLTQILTMTEFPDLENLKLCSLRDFPRIMKKIVAHINGLESKMKELKEENATLDEECETYARVIKDLKKEAVDMWKANKEATEELELEINRLKEEKNCIENEKEDLLCKVSKLDAECQKFKYASKTDGFLHNCACGNELKKINELKRSILVKEQKLLELQDLEAQMTSYKSQIEYLKTALDREKKRVGEEKEKNRKLQNELKEVTKSQKTEKKDDNQMLEELRMRGSISGGIVQEFVDKEKMRKMSKDMGILKELCRARYAEIKRLEALNAALRNSSPKNSNQMDSPIRSRAFNARSKNQEKDSYKSKISGKENSAL